MRNGKRSIQQKPRNEEEHRDPDFEPARVDPQRRPRGDPQALQPRCEQEYRNGAMHAGRRSRQSEGFDRLWPTAPFPPSVPKGVPPGQLRLSSSLLASTITLDPQNSLTSGEATHSRQSPVESTVTKPLARERSDETPLPRNTYWCWPMMAEQLCHCQLILPYRSISAPNCYPFPRPALVLSVVPRGRGMPTFDVLRDRFRRIELHFRLLQAAYSHRISGR